MARPLVEGVEPAPLTWKECFIQGALLVAALAIAFPTVFIGSEQISSADILYLLPPWKSVAPEGFDRPQNPLVLDPIAAFRPDYTLVEKLLEEGQWPLWNPLERTGVPLMANAQSTVFYPPHLIRALFDVDTTVTLYVLSKLWSCGAVAYLCVRMMGLSRYAARFFSITWMLGGYNFIWAPWPLPDVSAWVPVLVLAVEFLVRGRYQRGVFCMALGAALMLLAGHPETAFTFGIGAGLYAVVRMATARLTPKEIGKAATAALAGWGIALGVYMVQLLPLAEFILNSHTHAERVTDPEVLNDTEPTTVVAFWLPRFYGTMAENTFWDEGKTNSNLASMHYFGLVAWAGIAFVGASCFTRGSPSPNRSQVAAFTVSSVLLAAMACRPEELSFVAEWPLFSSVHPVYYVTFALFAGPYVAALGLDHWLLQSRRIGELWPVAVLAIAVIAVVFAVHSMDGGVIRIMGLSPYIRKQYLIGASVATAAVVVLLLYCYHPNRAFVWTALTVLTAADLLVAVHGIVPTMPQEQILPETELTRFLGNQRVPCRSGVSEAYIIDGVLPNYGIEEWGGYDGLYPDRIMQYRDRLGTELWDTMEPIGAVQYYVHDPAYEPVFPLEDLVRQGRLRLAARCDGLEVYENVGAMPRAFLARAVEAIPDRDRLFDRMKDPSYDPVATVLTELDLAGALLAAATTVSAGEATITEYTANRVQVQYESPVPAALVLADAFYPGWKASINDEPVELFPAYYAFRGAIVPEGRHTVVYEYDPLSFRIGLWISIVTMAGTSAYCVARLVRRRRIKSAAIS